MNTIATKIAARAQAAHRAVNVAQAAVSALDDSTHYTRAADAVADLHLAIGAARAWSDAEVALVKDETVEGTRFNVLAVIATRLARGADDTWSGRGNDFKRTVFDGYRSAADDIIELVRYSV